MRTFSLGTCHDQVRILFAQREFLAEKMRIIFTVEAYHSLCSKYCIDVKNRNPRNRSGVSASWLYLVVYNDHSINSQFSGFPTIFLFPFVNENSNCRWLNFEILANSFGNVLNKSPLLFDGSSFVRFNNNYGHIFLLSFSAPRCVLFPDLLCFTCCLCCSGFIFQSPVRSHPASLCDNH